MAAKREILPVQALYLGGQSGQFPIVIDDIVGCGEAF